MYLEIERVNPQEQQKISIAEFKLTTQMMDLFDMSCESDYSITRADEINPIICGTKVLGFAERYNCINRVPITYALFRPFKIERHADIIISMFEQLDYIDFDTLEISDYTVDGRVKYCGWLNKNGSRVDGSYIKISPSIPILKMSIVAALIMDQDEHSLYMKNLMTMLGKERRNEKSSEDGTVSE